MRRKYIYNKKIRTSYLYLPILVVKSRKTTKFYPQPQNSCPSNKIFHKTVKVSTKSRYFFRLLTLPKIHTMYAHSHFKLLNENRKRDSIIASSRTRRHFSAKFKRTKAQLNRRRKQACRNLLNRRSTKHVIIDFDIHDM